MITSIEFEGFKSLLSAGISFGQLTMLTGLNSSGKSSVIQAIQLIEKAATLNNDALYLPGHGALRESRNPYQEGSFIIRGLFSGDRMIEINENSARDTASNGSFPKIIHIAADRFGPETSVYADPNNVNIGKRGENIFRVIKAFEDKELPESVKHPLSQAITFEFNLRAWLNIISPNIDFKSEVVEQSDSSYSTFNGYRAKNVGFGLSYALPIITALLVGATKPDDYLVILENPEAHLHPRGQTAMAELICRCADAGLQILIETHSDHLFDGVRLYAKNSNVGFNEKIKAYWFELDENRNTDVITVVIDQNGRIDNWPEGMFDQFSINASNLLA
ncbi:AAA family ATPase [Rurimicrobium arvi]|uniref:DUF3696 domain-containing protein n=1 Tax=Rurimicrobium arvi TaxID=2049916 RepID=A0ABP8N108_9BACT